MTAVSTAAAPTFAWRSWRPAVKQVNGAACVAVFALALWQFGGPAARVMAAFMVLELVLLLLPWRLPRTGRSAAGFWAESLAAMVAPTAALVVVAFTEGDLLTRGASWWWYPVAVAGAALLLAVSGMNLRGVLSGELAFLKGPTPRPHALARATSAAVGPFGEEVLFRLPVLLAGATAPLTLLAAVAFVARHHVSAGTNRRGEMRSTLTELTGAAVLLALVAASGSLLPALLCHLLNNLPSIVMELQRSENDAEEW